MEKLVMYVTQHKVITLVVLAILFDLFIGILLACKTKKVNSAIGIDGMIRKVGMLGSIVFLVFVDYLLGFNLVGWVPTTILEVIRLKEIGISDLFGLLFACFEMLSIIKNWTLLGLPMFKGVNEWCENFLENFTNEFTSHKK